MPKPIIDKAEVSVDFPDKFYHGSFGRSSRFDVKVDDDGVHISLDRDGAQKRHVEFHIHHYLFCDVLEAVAAEIDDGKSLMTKIQLRQLQEAAEKIARAAGASSTGGGAA